MLLTLNSIYCKSTNGTTHFKPLIVDSENPEGQGHGNIRSLPRPLLLKSTFFKKSGRGRSITKPRPKSLGFKMPIIKAFK